MFAKVMEDAELCRDMLRLIFPGREVKDIIVHKREISASEITVITGTDNGAASVRKAYCKELLPQPVHQRKPAMNRLRGLSRRVLFDDACGWYDIELHVEDYNKLPPSYVIFICLYDEMGIEEPVYSFQMFEYLKTGDAVTDDDFIRRIEQESESFRMIRR